MDVNAVFTGVFSFMIWAAESMLLFFIWCLKYWWQVSLGIVALITLRVVISSYKAKYVYCQKCIDREGSKKAGRKTARSSFSAREDLGFQDGWHVEYENVTTHTQFKNVDGTYGGSSDSTSSVPRNVPDRTFYFRDRYLCADCGHKWTIDKRITVNR